MNASDLNLPELREQVSVFWEMPSNINTPIDTKESDDLLTRLLVMGIELKLQSVVRAVDEHIPRLEMLLGKKINEHLGFYGKLVSFG